MAAIVVALYAALGFWAAPTLIRTIVIGQVRTLYHRTARLDAVRVNPFALTLEARGFSLPDADGSPMIAFDRLSVRVAASSLWRGELTLKDVTLNAPQLHVVQRADGHLNLADLALPPDRSSSRLPDVVVDHFALRSGRIALARLGRDGAFAKTLSPVAFTLDHFSLNRGRAAYALSAVTDSGERLSARGRFDPGRLDSDGVFAIAGLKVAPLTALAGNAIPCDIVGGALDISGAYRFSAKGPAPRLVVDNGAARLIDVALRARGEGADWVSLPSLTVSGAHIDTAAHAVRLGPVILAGPAVTAWRERDGTLNLTRLAGPPKPTGVPAPARAKADPGPAWTLAAPDIRIAGGRIAFEERSAATPVRLTVSPLDLAVTGLAWPLAGPIGIETHAGLDGGGQIGAKGQVALATDGPAADLDVQISDIGLARFQPYVEPVSGVRVLAGALSSQGHLTFADKTGARFKGAVEIAGLHTVDRVLRQDFVNWRSLRLDGVDAASRPMAVRIALITAREPYARVVVEPNSMLNVQTVMNPNAGASPKPAPPPARPAPRGRRRVAPPPKSAIAPDGGLPVEIKRVKVIDGRMDFSDLTLTPNFSTGIVALNGTVTGLSGRQDTRAVVDLAGQVDRYAPLKIAGQINPFAAETFTDVTMDFRNMEMTTFSPYAGKFAGYRIEKGKLNLALRYVIQDQALHATHKVVINQLRLGERVDSAQAVKLPVKLIVSLLKDKNGVIDIPVTLDGRLDDPHFEVWPVIWKVVDNLFGKIAAAPFDLLGKLVGRGEELQYVDFTPGGTDLDPAAREKLTALAKALVERPVLNLDIPMAIDPRLDGPALADARFNADVAEATAALAAVPPPRSRGLRLGPRPPPPRFDPAEPATRRAILETLYRRETGAAPVLPPAPPPAAGVPKTVAKAQADRAAADWLEARLRARVVVTEAEFRALGRARAEAAQAAVLAAGGVDPSRVFIVTAPPADGAKVRMKLALD